VNFFYDLGRFSVDLDFDLLKSDKEIFVFEKIEKILQDYGTIKEKYRKKNTLLFVISYDEKSQNIKVEINCRAFGSSYELKNYLGISMLIMVKEDMFAHKLVTVLERKKIANRDVYDIWHFLKNQWPINKEIVEKRTGTNFKDYMDKCIEFIDSLSDRNILSGMGELLGEKQKAWAKTHLRKDTVFLLKVRLEQEK
jgi:predicted nucleotidyltransferase component of viral defense system